jgi:glycerol-3-phosphate responsive antiterminator
MSKQDFKKKRIVFDDTDIRHAQLKIRLQHDELTQAEFFRALISGYIDKDRHLINFINNYKEKKGIQSKKKRGLIKEDLEAADHLMGKFGIKDEELENIFDLIAKENPDL